MQKPVSRCLRACLALLLFLVAFADGREREEYVQLAWSLCIKLLICFILFCLANVVKTLLAKLLSSHFHKRAHFDKMRDALNKASRTLCGSHCTAWCSNVKNAHPGPRSLLCSSHCWPSCF